MKVVNANTGEKSPIQAASKPIQAAWCPSSDSKHIFNILGKTHNYNTRTLKDEFNSYPPWLNVGNHKRKIKRKKTAMRKNQFYTGAVHIGIN